MRKKKHKWNYEQLTDYITESITLFFRYALTHAMSINVHAKICITIKTNKVG